MKLKRSMIYILSLAATVVLFASCGQDEPISAPPLYEAAIGQIDSTPVTRGVVESLNILPGITSGVTDAVRLEANGGGQIGTIYAWPGDSVVEGQVIARLDTTLLDGWIERFEESIYRSAASHRLRMREMALEIEIAELSLLDAPEDTGLRERVAWLRLDRDHAQRRHNMDMAETEATLAGLLAERDEMEIRATFDGVVVYTKYLGTWVNTHDPIMYITRPGGVFVEFTGTAAEHGATMRAMVWGNYERVHGVIGARTYDLEFIPLTLEEQLYYSNRGLPMPLRFEIINGPDDMLPGQPVFIRLYTVFVDDALRIPINALFSGGHNDTFVYRVEEGQQVPTDVIVGATTETYAEILYGLREGDEVFVRP